jgi:DNA-binding transcriptional MerR regulator
MYTISQISQKLGVQPFVIRFWENNFPQLKSSEGEDDENLYSEEDFAILQKIKSLVIEQDLSLEEALDQMKDSSPEKQDEAEPDIFERKNELPEDTVEEKTVLKKLYDELSEIIEMMQKLI